MNETSPEVKAVLDKVEKLLRLAANNPNETEAASATAKAQDLLAAYNLDMAAVEENAGGTGKRMQEDLIGGRFEWQRDLWEAVADLNFCMYFNKPVFIESELGAQTEYRFVEENGVRKGRKIRGMWQHQHQVIGRQVNVVATKSMASYLESVCDRIVKDRVRNTNERANGRWANSFREGLTNKVITKIYDRRADVLNEEQAKRKAAMEAAAANTVSGVSTSNALTLSSYAKSEAEANVDFVFGEGTSAKWAAKRAAEAAAARAAEEEYTRWAAANPEKARKQEEERRLKEERQSQRRSRAHFKNKNTGAWVEGYKAGDQVSLDPQASHSKPRGYLR